ncbi:hypothetical protein BH93_21035 [Rhodococcoides fascians A25f]|uniref:hypothetical protein n=1 Tax=Rhodococcoides fascians TaxID=1828 RepID=UPI000567DE13|nr:hypothetical protein [Rhodococcus fascians]QII07528.1 hypothetical protein BH93_21035 [Rhodococcus fascians A25f]
MDASEALKKAWEAVEAAGVPDSLQEVAFSRALDLILGPPISGADPKVPHGVTHTQPALPGREDNTTSSASGELSEEAFYVKMSEGTGVGKDVLERLVHIDKGAPHLLLKGPQLPKNTAQAQKFITLVITVACHYFTGENEIASSHARDECEEYNVMDTNYNRNVDRIENFISTGSGQNRKVKIRRALLDSFGAGLKEYGNFGE